MTIQQLNSKLTDALIRFLNKQGHNATGTLERSIDFSSELDSNDNLTNVNFNAKEYIQFLDDGEFLDDFFSTKEFKDIMIEWYQDNIL